MKQYISLIKPASRLSAVLLLVGWVVIPSAAAALSPEQKKLYDSGIHYFDLVEDPLPNNCGAGGDTTSLTGGTPEEKVFNYFIEKGLTPIQAAGIMGSLAVESGFDPFNQENTKTWPSGGWGLAQWTAGRRITISNAVKADPNLGPSYYIPTEETGRNWPNEQAREEARDKLLLFQLNYLYNEAVGRTDIRNPVMPSGYNTAPFAGIPNEWEGQKKATTVEDAVVFWQWNYERPASLQASLPDRLAAANTTMTNFGSNPAGGNPSTGGQCNANGQVVGDFALPVDRHFYEENEGPGTDSWFTKPHHDYPAADIPVPSNTPVYSMTSGHVTHAPVGNACGTGVTIQHESGVLFTYCHGSDGGSVDGARQGDTVTAGQLIMHSDNTGNTSGPHLHVQIKVNGENRCPQELFVGIFEGHPPAVASLPSSGCTN